MEYALSLCDIFPILNIEQIDVEKFFCLCEQKSKYKFSRLCLGSNFCGRSFLFFGEKSFQVFANLCTTRKIKITLCVPLFTENELETGKQIIGKLLEQYRGLIDEITVNDAGMFKWVNEDFGLPVNTGRLMHKQLRDPRYPKHIKDITVVSPDYFPSYGMELDVVTSQIYIEDYSGTIAIHTPYTYWTTGKICQFSGLGADVFMKFNPGHLCRAECNKVVCKYITDEGMEFYQIGNSVFYKTELPQISAKNRLRILWMPLEIWEERYEYTRSHQQ